MLKTWKNSEISHMKEHFCDFPNKRISKKTISPCMQGYFWKVLSICHHSWRVLLDVYSSQDEWHHLLYSYYHVLPVWRRRYGLLSFIMLDTRLLLFYETYFLLSGAHRAHLWYLFKFIGHLWFYIYNTLHTGIISLNTMVSNGVSVL